MNKMDNLQKWQVSAPPPTQYSLTVCIQLIYHRVLTVISIFYSQCKCQSYFSIQLNSVRQKSPPHKLFKLQVLTAMCYLFYFHEV